MQGGARRESGQRALRSLLDRYGERDRELLAARRAARAAVLVPLLLWFGKEVLGDPVLASFAALGGMANLVFVNFGGPIRERMGAQALLALAGTLFVCLGTLASQVTWVAVAATFAFAFLVLFAGIFSSTFASATTVMLISFLLPVALRAPSEAIPDRMLGWLLASGLSVLAIGRLWPAPAREPLRTLGAQACRRLATQLLAEVDCMREHLTPERLALLRGLREQSIAATAALRDAFFATPYRPTGLSTSARTLARISDRVIWLDRIVGRAEVEEPALAMSATTCALSAAAASLLQDSADALTGVERDPRARLADAIARLDHAREAMQGAIESEGERPELISSLQPSFRAQEIAFVAAALAADVQLALAASRRSWWQRLLGRAPEEHGSAWSSIRQRGSAHLQPESVWLHNSIRGAAAFAIAVLVAEVSDVQHAFWVVFGTLAVLRTNAAATGQDAMRAMGGTILGILVGGGLVALIGAGSEISWLLLVPAVVLAALGPVVISFAVGQLGFTTMLLVLNNLLTPAGWSAGLVRIEDVAIGCGVSVLVAALFWPRGAGRALGRAIGDGLASGAEYVRAAVDYGASRCDPTVPAGALPRAQGELAVAASRRVDDAFRNFIAERGSKRLALPDAALLVGGVSLLRLGGDAIVDLWARDDRAVGGDRAAARAELARASESLTAWYALTAEALAGRGAMPAPPASGELAGSRLLEAIQRDIPGTDPRSAATAMKLIWTADHLDALARLRDQLVTPASAVTRASEPRP